LNSDIKLMVADPHLFYARLDAQFLKQSDLDSEDQNAAFCKQLCEIVCCAA
jgi:hypothetical protein